MSPPFAPSRAFGSFKAERTQIPGLELTRNLAHHGSSRFTTSAPEGRFGEEAGAADPPGRSLRRSEGSGGAYQSKGDGVQTLSNGDFPMPKFRRRRGGTRRGPITAYRAGATINELAASDRIHRPPSPASPSDPAADGRPATAPEVHHQALSGTRQRPKSSAHFVAEAVILRNEVCDSEKSSIFASHEPPQARG